MAFGMSYRPPQAVAAICARTFAFALVWWIISAGDIPSLFFGAPAALLAAAVSVMLSPPPWPRFRVMPTVTFLPYFIAQSFLGGIDVARRAFDPCLPIHPGFFRYSVAEMGRVERKMFVFIVNLMPGTLAVRLARDSLCVHAIDRTAPVHQSLATLEERLARVVGRDQDTA